MKKMVLDQKIKNEVLRPEGAQYYFPSYAFREYGSGATLPYCL